jgi:hypothetical protein
MDATPRKRVKAERRELAPLDPIDAIDGPAMKALPTDRHRAFVRALYQVKPGHGSGVKAAKLSGWGQPLSSAASMATIASRLMHDERILAAIFEEDQKRIRASAPRAINALTRLVEDPKHKDHARGIAMVLDRVHPAEQVYKVDHQHMHDVTPSAANTAETLKRIAELCAKFNVAGPPPLLAGPTIEGEATLISQRGGQ